jgi:hypothetical protein
LSVDGNHETAIDEVDLPVATTPAGVDGGVVSVGGADVGVVTDTGVAVQAE